MLTLMDVYQSYFLNHLKLKSSRILLTCNIAKFDPVSKIVVLEIKIKYINLI